MLLMALLQIAQGQQYNYSISNMKEGQIICDDSEKLISNNTEFSDLAESYYINLSAIKEAKTGTFTDIRDGQTYKWIKIGTQVWMAENLNFVSDNSWCYDKTTTNCDHYGRLYTWHAAMNGTSSDSVKPSNIQGVCPPGWHLPSHDEWTQLEQYVCNHLGHSDCVTRFPYNHSTWGWRGTNEGNASKSCHQSGSPLAGTCNTSEHPRWTAHDTHYGTDEVGFSALPGGYRWTGGSYGYLGYDGGWWSSTEASAAFAWRRYMGYDSGNVGRYYGSKTDGFSVRCVQDTKVP